MFPLLFSASFLGHEFQTSVDGVFANAARTSSVGSENGLCVCLFIGVVFFVKRLKVAAKLLRFTHITAA